MEKRIQQHGGVADRQDKAVTIGPERVLLIETKKSLPQTIGNRCEGHRRSWMARVRLLDRIHGQGSDGIDAELITVFVIHVRLAVRPVTEQVETPAVASDRDDTKSVLHCDSSCPRP
jgi:hypothetical protein